MREIDIDLSNHYSKSISDKDLESFDVAVTLCGNAKDKIHNSTFKKSELATEKCEGKSNNCV